MLPRHLYLHVPFCIRRCSYCDFSIAVRRRVPARDYVDAVIRELQLLRNSSGWTVPGAVPRGSPDAGLQPSLDPSTGGSLDTLYLGGGTPSLLPPDAVAALLRHVFAATLSPYDSSSTSPPHAVEVSAVEVTLEANPEDVAPETARAWRAAGVNRVSLGAQSFDDQVLKWMHRSHDAARIGEAVRTLRAAGIDNVSLDLIFGLPAELERDWERDLDLAHALRPTHLSLYGLTVEERTPLARWVSRGATRPPEDERYAEEYLLAHERLSAAGYGFYEVSNACRDGRRSRHNSAYWSGRPYVGLGPSAHSFTGSARRWNIAAWEAYRRRIAAGQSPVESEEVLTEEQQRVERIYVALRTAEGLPLTALYRPLPPSTARWVAAGWVAVRGGRVVCSPEGWLRLDALVADLTAGP